MPPKKVKSNSKASSLSGISTRSTRSAKRAATAVPLDAVGSELDDVVLTCSNNSVNIHRSPTRSTSSDSSSNEIQTHLQLSSGHGPQQERLKLSKEIEKFSGVASKWRKFAGALSFHTKCCTYNRVILPCDTRTWSDKDNEWLFDALRRLLDDKSWDMIERVHDKDGFNAFNYLQAHYLGSAELRKNECSLRIPLLKPEPGKPLQKYVTALHELEEEAVHFKLLNRDENGSCQMIISNSLAKLPARFSQWVQVHKQLYRQQGFPKLVEYTAALLEEDRSQTAEISQDILPVAAANVAANYVQNSNNSARNNRGNARQRRSKIRNRDNFQNYNNSGPSRQQQQHKYRTQHSNMRDFDHGQSQGRRQPYPYNPVNANSRPPHSRGGGSNRFFKINQMSYQCHLCKSNNGTHDERNCRSQRWCHRCQDRSHDTNRCHFRNRWPLKKSHAPASITTKAVLAQYHVSAAIIQGSSPGIIVDSGSAVHVFKDPSLFSEWDRSFDAQTVSLILADGTVCSNIKGKGTVILSVTDSSGTRQEVKLLDCLFMPSLNHSGIISVERGIDQNIQFHFNRRGSHMLIDNIKYPFLINNRLFHVNSVKSVPSVSRSALEWHKILGHLNFDSVYKTTQHTEGMQITHKNKRHCDPCLRNKARSVTPSNPDQRGRSPMQFIHADIAGPFNNIEGGSYDEYNYFVSFVDDFTGFIYVLPLRHKGDVLEAFENYIMFSKQFGSINRLRTDNAREFKSHAFANLCKRHGIFHEYSVKHTPHQNGTAERSMLTLHYRARCMINTSDLGQRMWPFAYQYAAYLYNRCYVARIQSTPFYLMYGYKPNVSKLRRFGSQVYALKYKDEINNKLDERSISGRFLGFSKVNGGFILLDQETDVSTVYPHILSSTMTPDTDLQMDGPMESPEDHIGGQQPQFPAPGQGSDTHGGESDLQYPKSRKRGGPIQDSSGTPPRIREGSTSGQGREDVTTQRGRKIRKTRFFGVNESPPGGGRQMSNLYPNHVNNLNRECKDVVDLRLLNDVCEYPKFYLENDMHVGQSYIHTQTFQAQIQAPPTNDNLSSDQRFHLSALKFCYSVDKVPQSYKEAISSSDSAKWQAAMNKELDSLHSHDTYKLVNKPRNTEIIRGRWVFSNKVDMNGTIIAKARWVAKGFMQCYGDNYTDTYAPMSRMTSLRCMMTIVAQYGYIAHQLDVTTAYLNAELDHVIYMEQPHGTGLANDNRVCLLRKSLYGLKQSAKLWNDTIHKFLIDLGFKRNAADMCLYQRSNDKGNIYLIIWVDDVVIIAENRNLVNEFMKQISRKFQVKDLGKLKYFLGIQFEVKHNSVQMSQSHYCQSIINRFHMDKAYEMNTPMEKNIHAQLKSNLKSPQLDSVMTTKYRELVGSLIYLEQITRPDISYATNLLGQQMSKPTQFHWNMGKKVLRYLKKTTDYSITYSKANALQLYAFSDADWAESMDRKSQSGYITYLAPNNSPISWSSRKQNLVARSTTEAEYIALSEAACEMIWLQTLLKSLAFPQIRYCPALLWCDNQGAQALTETHKHHKRTKHIDIKYKHVNNLTEKGTIKVKFVRSNENLADGFTKALSIQLYRQLVSNTCRINR